MYVDVGGRVNRFGPEGTFVSNSTRPDPLQGPFTRVPRPYSTPYLPPPLGYVITRRPYVESQQFPFANKHPKVWGPSSTEVSVIGGG